jgi:polyhydroxyalkanoate synthesis regulator phasin|tara:strand:+ start:56 stop:313 length:258 start_codon:yes stop_codon:yes gene_type:complete
MKDKRTYTKHKEHGEDISHENEIVIDFKQAQSDDTINKLRNNIRDLLSMNTQYKTELADQIVKINKLEQEIKDLKQERSDYYNVS